MVSTTRQLVGYSDDPTFDRIMDELGWLAGAWRETKEQAYVTKYQVLLRALLEMGWDDELDVELLLPDDLMPTEYFARYEDE
ncbi:MAG: hypothetical protein L0154_14790 [Chloroflexi bacterium]|nr:hypothetical protein [Chloroflexota bacterium]